MPIQRSDELSPDVETPTEPHLGFVTDISKMEYTAVPPGALMAIITDPTKPDGILPLLLTKVSERKLSFKCACGQPKCSAEFEYVIKVSGHHPRFVKAEGSPTRGT
jgi:hypothetical protein